MNREEIISKIKSYEWDHRVSRTGFFQSKLIVVDAVVGNTITLTDSITAHYSNAIWVNEMNLYDEKEARESFYPSFTKAFEINPDWPLEIVSYFKNTTPKKDSFIEGAKRDWALATTDEKVAVLTEYEDLLKSIQKYYTISFSLAKHCEEILSSIDEELLEYGESYEMLDVAKHTASLIEIQKSNNDEELISKHLETYAWIKVAYNILDRYTKEDVLEELKTPLHVFDKKELPDHEARHLIVGMQVGIFARNRIKEMSQQLWYGVENLAVSLAHDLGISRNDFFQLSIKEVVDSCSNGKLCVPIETIHARNKGFVMGYLDDTPFSLTGDDVNDIYAYFNKTKSHEVSEVKGATACKGTVTGIVRVIKDRTELHKLNKGEILVTAMTTPDFVVGMKIAGAIVTDEGGISCHAAIVSRELKIPCVIGTKSATKVLKDGDLVEVNADKGIVRRLESNKTL